MYMLESSTPCWGAERSGGHLSTRPRRCSSTASLGHGAVTSSRGRRCPKQNPRRCKSMPAQAPDQAPDQLRPSSGFQDSFPPAAVLPRHASPRSEQSVPSRSSSCKSQAISQKRPLHQATGGVLAHEPIDCLHHMLHLIIITRLLSEPHRPITIVQRRRSITPCVRRKMRKQSVLGPLSITTSNLSVREDQSSPRVSFVYIRWLVTLPERRKRRSEVHSCVLM